MQLKPQAGINVAELEERLRLKLKLSQELLDAHFSFEPSDIVRKVMSFGAPRPIEVAVSGPDFTKTFAFAQQIQTALSEDSSLRDLRVGQQLEYPAVKVDIDRRLAGIGVAVTRSGNLDRGHLRVV